MAKYYCESKLSWKYRIITQWRKEIKPTSNSVIVWFFPIQYDKGWTALYSHHREVGWRILWRTGGFFLAANFFLRKMFKRACDGARHIIIFLHVLDMGG